MFILSLCRCLDIEHLGWRKTLAVEVVQQEMVPDVGRVLVMLVTETVASGAGSSASSTPPRRMRIIEMVGLRERGGKVGTRGHPLVGTNVQLANPRDTFCFWMLYSVRPQ